MERDWQFGKPMPAKIDNAIRTCDSADAEAHYQLGIALEADEQFEPAAKEYTQACKLGPADSKYCADARWLSEKLHSS
jgi:hypothetical protein